MRVEDVLKGHGVGIGSKLNEMDFPVLASTVEVVIPTSSDLSTDGTLDLSSNVYYSTTSNRILKVDFNNLTTEVGSQDTTGAEGTILIDETYIYNVTYSSIYGAKFKKFNKETLELISERNLVDNTVTGAFIHGDYIYISQGYSSTTSRNKVRKYSKSDLSLAAESVSFPRYVLDYMIFDGEDIYSSARTLAINDLMVITKININTLGVVAQSDSIYSTRLSKLVSGGDFLYMSSTGGTTKYKKTDLTLYHYNSDTKNLNTNNVVYYNDNLYHLRPNSLQKIDIENLNIVHEIESDGGVVALLQLHNDRLVGLKYYEETTDMLKRVEFVPKWFTKK